MSGSQVIAFADSHVHLADPAFADDVDDVVARARAAGARALVCIGESPDAGKRAAVIAARFPEYVFYTCGVHPHDAHTWNRERDERAIRDAIDDGAVAIGECGLDYFYDNSPRAQQRQVLLAQLAIAEDLHRPLVVHTRDAEDDTRTFLRDAARAGVRGVLHCFTGTAALAEEALIAGWHISFSGIITFRRWTDEALLQLVPDDRLLVETDAPYLAPVPFRGKRNEPVHVLHTIARLAAARNTTAEAIAALTLHNTQQLFALPSHHMSFHTMTTREINGTDVR